MKHYSKEEKLAIIAEAESESATPTSISRKYGISKSTLWYWKKTILLDTTEEQKEARRAYQENIRLRSILIDKELEIKILKDLLKKGDQRRKKEKKQ